MFLGERGPQLPNKFVRSSDKFRAPCNRAPLRCCNETKHDLGPPLVTPCVTGGLHGIFAASLREFATIILEPRAVTRARPVPASPMCRILVLLICKFACLSCTNKGT
jgi:hypothetical protein